MNTKSRLYLCCSVAAILTALIFVGRRQPAPPASVTATESPISVQMDSVPTNSPNPVSVLPAFTMYRWRTGDHACWNYGVSMRLASAPENLAQSGETRLGGQLTLVVLASDAHQVTLAGSLAHAYYLSDGERVPRFEELMNSTPVILTLAPSGNLLELALPRHVAAEDRKILRLAYGWEFVVRNVASYQEAEYPLDEVGSLFRADYRRPDSTGILKRRLTAPTSPTVPEAVQNIITSEFTGNVGHVWVAEMAGWEDTAIYFNGLLFAMSRITVSFKADTNATVLPPALRALLSNPESRLTFTASPDPSTLQTESVSQAVRQEALASRWEGVPYDHVLGSLQSVAEGPIQKAVKPLHDLEEWLMTHADEGPAQVLQTLQAMQANQGDLSGLLVHALAEADTPQAREALASILGAVDAFPPTTAIQAAVAAGDLGEKTPQALKETLARLMDSALSDGSYRMSDTALYAFARIAKDDGAARDYLVQRVSPWLEANAVPEDTVKALSALANGAVDDPQLIARTAGFAKSADADIRLAAVEYLASLPSSSPGRTIIDQLASDPDERVQAEIERIRAERQQAVNP